jgi:hypothetical protein
MVGVVGNALPDLPGEETELPGQLSFAGEPSVDNCCSSI